MGNQAVLRVAGDERPRGFNVHWHGGRGDIASFLAETKIRLGRDYIYNETDPSKAQESDIVTFYATIAAVAREFFSYASKYKSRQIRNTYMCAHDVKRGTRDHGCYTIENDFTCSRIDMDNMSDYDAGNYKRNTEFFNRVDAALSTISRLEEADYRPTPPTTEELLAKHEHAKAIADNAAARLARVLEELKAHGITPPADEEERIDEDA